MGSVAIRRGGVSGEKRVAGGESRLLIFQRLIFDFLTE